MEIEINCCNNIDKANITLAVKKLNIKFAPNGTGKSTISRAIQCTVNGDNKVSATCFRLDTVVLIPMQYSLG